MLKAKQLLPQEHFADAGYVDSGLLINRRKLYGIELIGSMATQQQLANQS